MGQGQILIVEDDQRLCRLLSRYLERGGYKVMSAHNGDDMHQLLQDQTFDLLLLDIMLPGKDGLTLALEVRKLSDISIIFLTAKADISDKVNGLEIGADDYITKPFEEKELIARIHSVLRRSKLSAHPKTGKTLALFAGWKLNLINQTLTSPDKQLVEITNSEYQILSALVSTPNSVISRDKILSIISGREWTPLDRSTDMAISKLRKKIEQNPKKPALIKTIRNKGYQLTANVEFNNLH